MNIISWIDFRQTTDDRRQTQFFSVLQFVSRKGSKLAEKNVQHNREKNKFRKPGHIMIVPEETYGSYG